MGSQWSEILRRAVLLHLLACSGAEMSELIRAADGDAAVVVAAIAYESPDEHVYVVLSHDIVVRRLRGVLHRVCPGVRASGRRRPAPVPA